MVNDDRRVRAAGALTERWSAADCRETPPMVGGEPDSWAADPGAPRSVNASGTLGLTEPRNSGAERKKGQVTCDA